MKGACKKEAMVLKTAGRTAMAPNVSDKHVLFKQQQRQRMKLTNALLPVVSVLQWLFQMDVSRN